MGRSSSSCRMRKCSSTSVMPAGIERAGGDKRIGAQLLSDLTVLDHALGLGVDDADQNGNAVVDDTDGLGDDLTATLVGGEDDLARGAQEEQAIDAASIMRLMLRSKEATSSWWSSVSGTTTGGITPVNF